MLKRACGADAVGWKKFATASAIALTALLAGCGDDGGAGETTASTEAETTAPSSESASNGAATSGAASSGVQAQSQEIDTPEIDFEALEAKGYVIGDVPIGDPNAPVTLVEYASLTCPHCRDFHQDTLPAIKREYVETGKLRVIVRELHGHRIGLYAAALARCGGASKYHAFMDVLFSRQDAFRTQDPNANLAELRRIGKLGGLSPERIEECLNDNLFLNALYQTSAENIERDGVEATPYLIIQPGDDQKVIRGAAGPDQLGAVIDGFLAE